MWGGKKQQAGGKRGSTTLISRSTEIVGDIHFSGYLEVEGRIRGNIFSDEGGSGSVRVVQGGVVEGDIRAPNVTINGHVVGDVYASGQLELIDKAVVEGNVHYKLIEVAKGAQVNGSLMSIENGSSNSQVVTEKVELLDDEKAAALMSKPLVDGKDGLLG